MSEKRQIVDLYKDTAAVSKLYKWVSMSRSNYYYKVKPGKRGRKPTAYTLKKDNSVVTNTEVINTLVREVYEAEEFNRYGYLLSTCELKDLGFIINHKKVYRLMKASGLLLERFKTGRIERQWVKWRKIIDAKPLDYICMDIKYVYIHGDKRNAYLLAILDVATRYVLGWALRYSMKHPHVIMCLDEVMGNYPSKEIILRTDNGSQFIAKGLSKYLKDKPVTHEFTHVATPEENSYVESLFSNVERDVIQRYEFESIYDSRDVFKRYFHWYNTKRRHHGIGRINPLKYWNSQWASHPVRPPVAEQDFSGQDFFQKNTTPEGVEIFLEKPEGPRSWNEKDGLLYLPCQDDDSVLN
jgi:putative transposase